MSIITLFTAKSPTIAGFEFDAVLEDTFEASVTTTGYTLETGSRVADHRIINPFKWRLTGAVSNNPLKASVLDVTAGALSNIIGDSGIAASVAGLSAGFLAGSTDTRASETLSFLLSLMVSGDPFDIDAGDIQLSNMIIIDITRIKNPANEGGLIFDAQLEEFPTLDTILTQGDPLQNQLHDNDPAKSQAARDINKGEQGTSIPDASTTSAVSGVLI